MSTATQDATVEIVTQPHKAIAAVTHRGATPFLSRDQILVATAGCFAETGYDGTTIRAIAARLKCSVGSIYRYFLDKRELLLACGERALRPAVKELEQGAGFEQSLRSYLRTAAQAGELYRLQFWLASTAGHGTGAPPVVGRILDAWTMLLGGREEAEQCWARAHGLLIMGWSEDAIVGQLLQWQPATEAISVPASTPDQAEDMTLL